MPPKNRRLNSGNQRCRSADNQPSHQQRSRENNAPPPNLMDIASNTIRPNAMPLSSSQQRPSSYTSGPSAQQYMHPNSPSRRQSSAGYHNVPPPPVRQQTQPNSSAVSNPNGTRIGDRLMQIANSSPKLHSNKIEQDLFQGFLEYYANVVGR